MVTMARELRGFTKKELASKIGKTPATVTRIEKGSLVPDLDTFFILSTTLRVPPAFFSKPQENTYSFQLSDCFFRGKASVSMKDKRQITTYGKRAAEFFLFFQQQGVLFPEESIYQDEPSDRSVKNIEELALHTRNKLGLGFGPVHNLIKTLEAHGAFVVNISSDSSKKVDAFSVKSEERPLIFLYKNQSPSRLLFDIAHELGHILLHEDVCHGAVQEREANRFASAFLMPWEKFMQECPRRWNFNAFLKMKNRWKVSISALLYRAKSLNLLSDSSYKRAMIDMNRRGFRVHEPEEPEREKPSLCEEALELLNEKITISDIESFLRLHTAEVIRLLEDQYVSSELIDKISVQKKKRYGSLLQLSS